MLKRTKNFAYLLIVFMLPLVLAGCGKTQEKTNMDTQIQTQTEIEGMNAPAETEATEQITPSDKMEFTDPGNDEIGKEIRGMDDLLNQTTPSEYSEDDLAEDVIENGAELR